MSFWFGVGGAQATAPPLSMSYSSAYMMTGSNSPTVSPTVSGGDGSTKTYAYSGTLPTGVGFSTTTGTFTGPSSSSWSAISDGLSAASTHACMVTFAGELRCWGDNSDYQLGTGSTTFSTTTFVNPSGLASGVSSVSVGSSPASCAVTTAGGLKCWGRIDFGGGTVPTTPTDVTGLTSGVVSVSVGHDVAAALTTSGAVLAWGWDGGYSSGMNAPISSPVTPVAAGSGLVSISCGGSHCCGITSSGGAKCWGQGMYGQIGNGSTSYANGYSDVTGLTSGVVSISAGHQHSCAVTTAGEVKCWGRNADGRLGDGTTTDQTTPVTVSGFSSGGASVSVGTAPTYTLTCVVQTTGGVKCWGASYAAVGSSGAADYTTPVQVSGVTSGVEYVSAGGYSTCAQTNSGGIYCWGYGLASSVTPVFKTGTGPHSGFPASITATVTDSSSSSSTSINLQAIVPPSTPTNLTVSVSSNTASLSWSAPKKTYGSSVTGYNVSYSTPSASGPWTSHTSGQAGTTATIGSLTPGSTYWFKVEAVTAAVLGIPAVATAINYGTPGAPTNVTASSAYQALTFSWTAPANTGGGISDYKLQRSSDNSTWTTISDGVSTATSHTISGLSNNQTVYFRVAASNPSGDGAYSTSASGTTINPKASGGTITYSGGKFIHTFTTSGTFAPTTSISATALCVAGGYNGADATSNASGAGGAGGQVVTGTQTVSTSRTIAVGSVGGGTSSISGWISASGVGVAGGASKTVQGQGNNGIDGTQSSIEGFGKYYGSSGGSGGYVSDQVNLVYFFGGIGGRGAGGGGFAGGKVYYNYNWTGNSATTIGSGGGGGAASAGIAPSAGGAGLAGVVVISYT